MDTSTLIVKFPGSDITYTLTEDEIKKYPSSVFYGHYYNDGRTNNECELNTQPEVFEMIYQVITGKKRESELPKDVRKIANKYGLTNDAVYALKCYHKEILTKKVSQFESFLESGSVLQIKNKMFEFYNQILKGYPNVHLVTVAWYKDLDELAIFYRNVLIYPEDKIGEYSGRKTIDVYKMRYQLLLPWCSQSRFEYGCNEYISSKFEEVLNCKDDAGFYTHVMMLQEGFNYRTDLIIPSLDQFKLESKWCVEIDFDIAAKLVPIIIDYISTHPDCGCGLKLLVRT